MKEIITSVASFFAFLMHSITGFGGNILVFPVLTFLYGTNSARICLNLIAWVSSICVTVDCHNDINFKEYRHILGWMSVGLIFGYCLIPYIKSEKIIMLIYGVIIVFIAMQKLLVKNSLTLGKKGLTIILIVAGIIQAVFVSGGAFLVIYCAQVLKEKREFRGTFTAIWLSIYTATFLFHYFGKGYEIADLKIALWGGVPVILASIIGNRIAKIINQRLFMKIVYVFILLVGISLVTSNILV